MYNELYHHGIKGQKWGVRRYQNTDGSIKRENPLNKVVRKTKVYKVSDKTPEKLRKADDTLSTLSLKIGVGSAVITAATAGLYYYKRNKVCRSLRNMPMNQILNNKRDLEKVGKLIRNSAIQSAGLIAGTTAGMQIKKSMKAVSEEENRNAGKKNTKR